MEKKTLKFVSNLVPLILAGKKYSTWRLWDDKKLSEGDIVTLIKRPEMQPFGKAKLISVIEKSIGQLSKSDKKGHETFESNEQMYTTYSTYYGRLVNSKTLVKIIKFKLIK